MIGIERWTGPNRRSSGLNAPRVELLIKKEGCGADTSPLMQPALQ